MNCEFSNPVNFQNEPPEEGEFWQFKNANCEIELPPFYAYLQNPETEAEFYLDKTFSYGDILITIFLSTLFIVLITVGIFKFFFKKWW